MKNESSNLLNCTTCSCNNSIQRIIRTRYASTTRLVECSRKISFGFTCFRVTEEKSFHARPSRTHSNSSSQPKKSFTTHYQHVPSAFPLHNRVLSVSFCSLTQQRPGENLSIIAQEKVFLPSPLVLGTGQFSRTIQPVAFEKLAK